MLKDKKTPEIRFKGFTEDWEQRKWIDMVNISTEMVDPKSGKYDNLPHIGPGNIESFTGQFYDNIKKVGEENLISGKFHFYPEDIIYGKINPQLGKYVFPLFEGLSSADSYVLNAKNGLNQKYLYTLLQTTDFYKYSVSVSMRSGMPKINRDELNAYEFSMPKGNEQQQIGALFLEIDNLITLHQRKCDKLLNFKKSMLEKMFPKNSSNFPEIRFKGFTDAWEQRKFGEMADYKKGPFGSALKKEIFVPKSKDSVKVYEQQNAINKDWKLERYFITKEYANKLRNFETHSGDIIISCAGTIGEIYELPLFSEPGIINQALMRVRVDEKQINKDMYKIVFSNMIDDFSKEHSNGSAMKNIPPFADLKPMEVLIPKSSEQKEITDLFNNLDNLITLHQRKLEKLKNIKTSMLNKMFI